MASTVASLATQPSVDFGKMAPDPTKDVAKGQTHHPSALRNRVPILKALLKLLPDSDTWEGDALEVATGTGALLEVLAPAYPKLSWLPSEYVPEVAAAPEEQWSKRGWRCRVPASTRVEGMCFRVVCLGATAVRVSRQRYAYRLVSTQMARLVSARD